MSKYTFKELLQTEEITDVGFDQLDVNTRRFTEMVRLPEDSDPLDNWERAIYYAQKDLKIIDTGFIPDADFGSGGTNYLQLTVLNKGSLGDSNVQVSVKDFTAVLGYDDFDYYSLGTIINEDLDAGETLTIKTNKYGLGEILPSGVVVLYFERAE